MAFNDDSFIREVNEELRSDQLRVIWRRFGRLIIALAVLIVVATAVYSAYRYWSSGKANNTGDKFMAALALADQNKPDEALKALDAIEQTGQGDYPVLAKIRAASVTADKGDPKSAIAMLQSASKDTSAPEVVRDAARLRAGFLLVANGTYDQVSAEVEELTAAENPFRASAREILGLSAYKNKDFPQARQWFQTIVEDAQSPRNVVNRAQMMLDLMNSAGQAPAAKG